MTLEPTPEPTPEPKKFNFLFFDLLSAREQGSEGERGE